MKALISLAALAGFTLGDLAAAQPLKSPMTLRCEITVTLSNGQLNQRTFDGIQEPSDGFVVAEGIVGLLSDNPLSVHFFYDGRVGSINLLHEATGVSFNADSEAGPGEFFTLNANVPEERELKAVGVSCKGTGVDAR